MLAKNDQMPAGGCEKCGAYVGERQSVLKARLVREENAWLCRQCAEELRSGQSIG